MKLWGAIFNMFAAIFMLYLLVFFYQTEKTNARQLEELKFRYAVDYAVEGAFRATLSIDDLGMDYTNLGDVKLNPSMALETFKAIMCLNYDMALSEENYGFLETHIPTGVIFTNDGYYILEKVEKNNPLTIEVGGDYALQWSVKRPYTVVTGGYTYGTSIYSDAWIGVKNDGGTLVMESGDNFTSPRPTGLTRKRVREEISKQVTEGINRQIYLRNLENTNKGKVPMFYLPSSDTTTAINNIKRPTLLMLVQGLDISGVGKMDAMSVGGNRVDRRRVVVGFEDGGKKFYCYEKQLPEEKINNSKEFFQTLEDAALAGYIPHLEYLSKFITSDDE